MKKYDKIITIVYVLIMLLIISFVLAAHLTTNATYIKVYKPITFESAGEFKITGYDTCARCCGKSDGITASGNKAIVGTTCASNYFPFGTKLYIVGIGYRTVEDRGGMKNNVIDILCNNHEECYAITGTYKVYVVHYGTPRNIEVQ